MNECTAQVHHVLGAQNLYTISLSSKQIDVCDNCLPMGTIGLPGFENWFITGRCLF
jgi:hypothetical protein